MKTLEVTLKLSDDDKAIKYLLPLDDNATVTNETLIEAIKANKILSKLAA